MHADYDLRRIVISCRTQFFSSDEEIPKQVGTITVGVRAAGEPAEYTFHKLYLSPFTDDQANQYLRRRYPLIEFKWLSRRRARRLAEKIPHLRARPMLLAHIDDLVESEKKSV